MERLTYNEVLAKQYYPNENIDNEEIFNKLGKLEDIEQELGIPLEVLFKALKDGIYADFDDGNTRESEASFRLGFWKKNFVLDVVSLERDEDGDRYETIVHPNDYGFTWSLTREELEDAKD